MKKFKKKIDHWQKIANHACEQSGRSVIVSLSNPLSLEELLEETIHDGFVLHHRAQIGLSQLKETSKATAMVKTKRKKSDGVQSKRAICGLQGVRVRSKTASWFVI